MYIYYYYATIVQYIRALRKRQEILDQKLKLALINIFIFFRESRSEKLRLRVQNLCCPNLNDFFELMLILSCGQ